MKIKILLINFFIFYFFIYSRSWASFSEPLFKGAEAQAMGDAVTAVVDDDFSLFYNPAGLAGVNKLKFRFVNITVEASDQIIGANSTFSPIILGNFNSNFINSLFGTNNYVRVQEVASVSFQGFSAALIGDGQGVVELNNPNNPSGTVGVQTTYGGQVGFGGAVLRFDRNKGELRLGVSGKYLLRAGGFTQVNATDLLNNQVSSLLGNYRSFGSGLGADFGTQAVYQVSQQLGFKAGFAALDLGNTVFSNGAPSQKSNFATGIGVNYKSYDVVGTFSFEIKHIFDDMDWQKKVHLGLQLKLPLITLSGGLSELYPTYGVGVNLGVFQIQYTHYLEELASLVGINPEARTMLNARVEFVF
jgi:hypothetical protein